MNNLVLLNYSGPSFKGACLVGITVLLSSQVGMYYGNHSMPSGHYIAMLCQCPLGIINAEWALGLVNAEWEL